MPPAGGTAAAGSAGKAMSVALAALAQASAARIGPAGAAITVPLKGEVLYGVAAPSANDVTMKLGVPPPAATPVKENDVHGEPVVISSGGGGGGGGGGEPHANPMANGPGLLLVTVPAVLIVVTVALAAAGETATKEGVCPAG